MFGQVTVDAKAFRELISGQRRGLRAAVARGLLPLTSVPYGVCVRLRNRAYDVGLLRARHVPVPVVSVGNLTLGGTGKTPFVEYLARWFRDRGLRVVILSRGYKTHEPGGNDEFRVLRQNLPDIAHLQGPDRVGLARRAIREHGAQVLILDDGFQHRRLARDLDLVLVDALDPEAGRKLFPRGLLREPACGLGRADLVMLSRVELCSPAERERVHHWLERWTGRPSAAGPTAAVRRPRHDALPATACVPRPAKPYIEIGQRAWALMDASGRHVPLENVSGQSVAAFCGIGNPEAFRRTLERLGAVVLGSQVFADHHVYGPADVEDLARWVEDLGVEVVLTTQKDLVKFRTSQLGGRPLWAVAIRVEVLSGEAELEQRLREVMGRAPPAV